MGAMGNHAGSMGNQHLLCPITQDLMMEPVLAADGHAYERAAIEDWISIHGTSPVSGEPLASATLIPCHTLRNMTRPYRSFGGASSS